MGREDSSSDDAAVSRQRIDANDLVSKRSRWKCDIDLFPRHEEVRHAINANFLDGRHLVNEPQGAGTQAKIVATARIGPERFPSIAR